MAESTLTKIHDLHVHLHGCLTADDVHELGQKTWQSQTFGLKWFADEYSKATGTNVLPCDYWLLPNGKERLKSDFVMNSPGDFSVFQARFNLLIALFPITPKDTSILERIVLRDLKNKHLGHREYRLFVPPRFSEKETIQYVSLQATKLAEIAKANGCVGKFSLAFSLSRSIEVLKIQYRAVKDWQRNLDKENSGVLECVTGIDLCGEEANCPPSSLQSFFQTLHTDNQQNPEHALALLYHVGEQWHQLQPETSIQWVVDAARQGAHRLGHALSVRVSPEVLASAKSNTNKVSVSKIATLQADALSQLRDLNAVIEACPTSNQMIAGTWSSNTLIHTDGLNGISLVMGTDNPGLLKIDLANEWTKFTDLSNFSGGALQHASDSSISKFFSATLCGRTQT